MPGFLSVLTRPLVMLAAGLLATAAAAAQTPHPVTAEDVGDYFDGVVPASLQKSGIPGAVVLVVKDGAILFAKGYGVADLATERPVDPDRTLFRPGSISKTFLWTAVMQLAEARRLDLDRDVNDYLDFRIPDAWGKPITLRNLMTHTAGFEDRIKDIVYTPDQDPPTNEQFVKSSIPRRIFPPGAVTAYSNYGAALAGYIVARVSGQPFEDYVEQHIFMPLGMTHSSFRQPLPAALAADMASGYLPDSTAAQPFEFVGPAPAGALSATAADMAKFMIAHLQLGRLGDARILGEDTARLMHATSFQPSTVVNGLALGFRHEDLNGQSVIAHAGSTVLFHSDMHLFLDQGIGFFVSFNSAGRDDEVNKLRPRLLTEFADRYFPQALPEEPALGSAHADGLRVEGTYEATQRTLRSLGGFLALLGQTRVAVDEAGIMTISTLTGADGAPRRWREVAPRIWRDQDSPSRLEVQFDDDHVSTIVAPPLYVFQPVPFWRSAAWNLPLLMVTLAGLLIAAIAWPVWAIIRRLRRKPSDATALTRAARLAALTYLVHFGGILALVILVISPAVVPLNDRLDGWFRLLQLFGLAGALGTAAAVADAAAAWRRGASWPRRLSGGAVALTCLAATWFALAFHTLSWSLDF